MSFSSLFYFSLTQFFLVSLNPMIDIGMNELASYIGFLWFVFSLNWVVPGEKDDWFIAYRRTKVYYRDNIGRSMGILIGCLLDLFWIYPWLPLWIIQRWSVWVCFGNLFSFLFYINDYSPARFIHNRFLTFLGVDVVSFVFFRLSLVPLLTFILSCLWITSDVSKIIFLFFSTYLILSFSLLEKKHIQNLHRYKIQPSFSLFWSCMAFYPLCYFHLLVHFVLKDNILKIPQ